MMLAARTVPLARAASALGPRALSSTVSPEPCQQSPLVPHYDGWDAAMERDFSERAAAKRGVDGRKRSAVTDGICDSALDLVGKTPMVRMSRLLEALNVEGVEVAAKCEFMNAGGSLKDRVGLRMIEEAEAEGRIKPGDTLIEATSGNTGIGLCLAGAVKGYKVVITLPQKMSGEKVNTMRALGASIVRTPTEAAWNAPDSHITVAAEMADGHDDRHVLDQYLNAGNPLAHYEGTAEEILQQTGGAVDVVVAAAGTGGTITGIARKLKEAKPDITVVAVDPVGSILAQPESMNDAPDGYGYQVEGIGYDFLPSVLDRSLIDEWVKVDDPEAFAMARSVIKHEGLLVGGSAGSAIAGALAYVKANEEALQGKRVVVVCADSIRNYMSKFLDDGWMAEHNFEVEEPNKDFL